MSESESAMVLDQELVVHLFAPLTGPDAAAAYDEIGNVWRRCREKGRMREPVKGLGLPDHLPDPQDARLRPGATNEVALAAQQARSGVWQAVLRRHHDVLNLSVALTPASGAAPEPEVDWTKLDRRWDDLGGGASATLLGVVRIYQAVAPSPATAVDQRFAEVLRDRLPARGVADEWRTGAVTASGFGMWEVGTDGPRERRLLILAPPGRGRALSAWSWSRGDAALPPLARCLLHGALIRYQDLVYADATTRISALDGIGPGDHEDVIADGELTAAILTRHLQALHRSVGAARSNIRLLLGADADALFSGPGPLASDVREAGGLLAQIESDLAHIAESAAHLREVRSIHSRAAPAIVTPREQPPDTRPEPRSEPVPQSP